MLSVDSTTNTLLLFADDTASSAVDTIANLLAMTACVRPFR